MKNLDIINILNAYFNNCNLELSFTEVQANFLIKKMRHQALSQFLYPVYKNKLFKKDYIINVINHEKFLKMEKDIKNILNENKIDYVLLKGSCLYHLYQDNAIRSRGDIDFLVKEEDYYKVIKILSANGFEKSLEVCEHHTKFKKDDLSIELHRSLFDSSEEFYKYFNDPFSHVIYQDGLKFEPTYNLEYILCHYALHIKSFGAGIRPILDICLMILHTDINHQKLKENLISMGLYQFYEIVLNVGKMIFDGLPFVNEYDVSKFIDFVMESGIHGDSPDNKDRVYKKNAGKSKIGYIFSKVFPKPRILMNLYPRCRKLPFLLPFYWFKNLFRLIFKKSKVAIDVIKCDNDKKDEYVEFYRSIGL